MGMPRGLRDRHRDLREEGVGWERDRDKETHRDTLRVTEERYTQDNTLKTKQKKKHFSISLSNWTTPETTEASSDHARPNASQCSFSFRIPAKSLTISLKNKGYLQRN